MLVQAWLFCYDGIMNKQRNPNRGPFLSIAEKVLFEKWCVVQQYNTRLRYNGCNCNGIDVRYNGHWMGVIYNKGFNRYTVDKRMAPLIEEFKNA